MTSAEKPVDIRGSAKGSTVAAQTTPLNIGGQVVDFDQIHSSRQGSNKDKTRNVGNPRTEVQECQVYINQGTIAMPETSEKTYEELTTSEQIAFLKTKHSNLNKLPKIKGQLNRVR